MRVRAYLLAMSQTLRSERPPFGTTLKALGAITVGVALLGAIYSVVSGDPVTGGAILLYLPVGWLLYRIGANPDQF